MLQNPTRDHDDAAFAIVTGRVGREKVEGFKKEVEMLDWCRGEVFFMPILRDEEF